MSVYCQRCGKEISDVATNCPYCNAIQNTSNVKKNTSILRRAKIGYIRGLVGQPEKTEEARMVYSPAPLKDKTKVFKTLYIICFICCAGGLFSSSLLALGIFGLMIVYIADDVLTNYFINRLRVAKFKFDSRNKYDDLFKYIQMPLYTKYGMMVEQRNDGMLVIKYDGILYDISIEDDNTFTIWWRMGLGRAIISLRRKKLYRKVLVAMGIIAYEMQSLYGINR